MSCHSCVRSWNMEIRCHFKPKTDLTCLELEQVLHFQLPPASQNASLMHSSQSRHFSTATISFPIIRNEKPGATESCLSLTGHPKYDGWMLSESSIICYHFIHILSSASDYFLSETIPSVHLVLKAPRPHSQSVWVCEWQSVSSPYALQEKTCFNGTLIASHKDVLFI